MVGKSELDNTRMRVVLGGAVMNCSSPISQGHCYIHQSKEDDASEIHYSPLNPKTCHLNGIRCLRKSIVITFNIKKTPSLQSELCSSTIYFDMTYEKCRAIPKTYTQAERLISQMILHLIILIKTVRLVFKF